MNPKVYFFILIIVGGILEVIADIFLKKWSQDLRTVFMVVGILFYTIGTIFWAYSLRFEQLSKAAILFNLVNLILAVIAGYLIFNESLSFQNKVGVVLALVSIYLIES